MDHERKARIEEYIKLGERLKDVADESELEEIVICVGALREVSDEIDQELLLKKLRADLKLYLRIDKGKERELGDVAVELYKEKGYSQEEVEKRFGRLLYERENAGKFGRKYLKDARVLRFFAYLLTPFRKTSKDFHQGADFYVEHGRLLLEYSESKETKKRAIRDYRGACKRIRAGKKELIDMIRENTKLDEKTVREMADKREEQIYPVLDEAKIKYGL